MIYSSYYNSPFGKILLAAENDALIGLWFENQKYFLSSLKGKNTIHENYPVLIQTGKWLDRYFAGEKPEISELNINPSGSEFRRDIWKILCKIPYGEITSYGEISKIISEKYGIEKMSAQAVGGAVGHNAISIIIPCHRVVGANGSLTGYAGGIDRKIKLLEHEGVNMEKLFVPPKAKPHNK